MAKPIWNKILQVAIAVLSAILGAAFEQRCGGIAYVGKK